MDEPAAIPSSTLSSSERIPVQPSPGTISEPVEPLHIPHSTPEAEKAKRNEIRHAWHFLHSLDHQHPQIHLGPLPSSWPTAKEDGFYPHSDTEPRRQTSPEPDQIDPVDSQLTGTLSISSSAFASQDQTGQFQQDGSDSPPSPTLGSGKTSGAPRSLNRQSSSFARRAAYLAARADSYDAWALMGLVSVGDNHTTEETEL